MFYYYSIFDASLMEIATFYIATTDFINKTYLFKYVVIIEYIYACYNDCELIVVALKHGLFRMFWRVQACMENYTKH